MPDGWSEREAILLDVLLCTSEALRTAPAPRIATSRAGEPGSVDDPPMGPYPPTGDMPIVDPVAYAGWYAGHRAGALAKVRAWDTLTAGDGRQTGA